MNEPPPAGLCASCRRARALTSSGGSVFYQCLRAESDPRYPKWPRLPVLSCPGHEPGEGEAMV
ncbi:MAG: hypothetical protein ACHQ51_10570 [Elusimicrobiota bacterium]